MSTQTCYFCNRDTTSCRAPCEGWFWHWDVALMGVAATEKAKQARLEQRILELCRKLCGQLTDVSTIDPIKELAEAYRKRDSMEHSQALTDVVRGVFGNETIAEVARRVLSLEAQVLVGVEGCVRMAAEKAIERAQGDVDTIAKINEELRQIRIRRERKGMKGE